MPFVTANGIRLYYEWHGAGNGVPGVLAMGLRGDSTAWPFQLAALTPRHRVLVFDNRGAGRSDAPDLAYTTRGMAEDLLALLDALGVVARRGDRPGSRRGQTLTVRTTEI